MNSCDRLHARNRRSESIFAGVSRANLLVVSVALDCTFVRAVSSDAVLYLTVFRSLIPAMMAADQDEFPSHILRRT